MFTCFGFLGLVKAYKNFCYSYIPYIKEKLAENSIKPESIDKGGQENGRQENHLS